MDTTDVKREQGLGLPENLFCAGTSAFLVALPHIHPQYTVISLFALVPFLWRACRGGFIQSFLLGAVFGAVYCLLTARISLSESPATVLFCMTSVIIIFSVYSAAANRIAKHVGFSAVFFAIFWLPVEHALGSNSHLGKVFFSSDMSSSVLVRMGYVFGVLMISFLTVLINALILVVSSHLGRLLRPQATFSFHVKASERILPFFDEALPIGYALCNSGIRAPPSVWAGCRRT